MSDVIEWTGNIQVHHPVPARERQEKLPLDDFERRTGLPPFGGSK